jgi:hypothetical protein
MYMWNGREIHHNVAEELEGGDWLFAWNAADQHDLTVYDNFVDTNTMGECPIKHMPLITIVLVITIICRYCTMQHAVSVLYTLTIYGAYCIITASKARPRVIMSGTDGMAVVIAHPTSLREQDLHSEGHHLRQPQVS